MKLFLFEYLTSGAAAESLPQSLLVEGRAMLLALAADCARLDGCKLTLPWDVRLGPIPSELACHRDVRVIFVESPEHEQQVFAEQVAQADLCWIIAPETAGLLSERLRQVNELGGAAMGPALAHAELFGDKLATCEHFRRHGLPTIPTQPLCATPPAEYGWPLVIKPRDGAGSQETFLVETAAGFESLLNEPSPATTSLIVQPRLGGRAISVAAIIPPGACQAVILPPVDQLLSQDGRFRYLGGRLEVPSPAELRRQLVEVVLQQALEATPGLCGYVGFDLILPDDARLSPVIVEVNPRLTTSYIGYRALCRENLAGLVVGVSPSGAPAFHEGAVHFAPDGRLAPL